MITDLEKPLNIVLYTDKNFKITQYNLVTEDKIESFADMKTMIDANVTGTQTFDKTPANMLIRIHFYNRAPTLTCSQESGQWKVVFSMSATPTLINEIETFLNS